MIPVEPRGIEQHLILHNGAAESGIIGHTAHLFVFALDHPIFKSFQFLRRAVRGFQHVAINKARRTGKGRERRRYPSGVGDFAKPLKNNLPREIIVGVFVEGQNHVRQPVQRDRPLDQHLRHAVHFYFGRKRDQPFHFFRGVPRPLGDHLDHRRRKVRIGIHRHALKRNRATDGDEHHQHQDQEPLLQRELD